MKNPTGYAAECIFIYFALLVKYYDFILQIINNFSTPRKVHTLTKWLKKCVRIEWVHMMMSKQQNSHRIGWCFTSKFVASIRQWFLSATHLNNMQICKWLLNRWPLFDWMLSSNVKFPLSCFMCIMIVAYARILYYLNCGKNDNNRQWMREAGMHLSIASNGRISIGMYAMVRVCKRPFIKEAIYFIGYREFSVIVMKSQIHLQFYLSFNACQSKTTTNKKSKWTSCPIGTGF